MATTTSTLHPPFGFSPRGPHGGQQMQGPPHSAPGPSAAPHPEEQRHKPFFYIQPSQPYMAMQSMQWPVPLPMPVSYNPYYGYPGIGYGMPMVPPYPPNPYMEAPGFVVPHSHLHLMDYRRMLNPQYYQSMAYHARRLRYQQNAPSREMTSSEVQTEPLSGSRRTNTPGSSSVMASGGLNICSSDSISITTSQSLCPALAVQEEDQSLELKDVVASSATRMPPNSSFVIQTEEVRIECCTTPVGLQVLHSHETAEVSHSFTKDVVQCSAVLHGHVLQDDNLNLPVDQSEQAQQACPDILLVGTPCSSEKPLALEESRNQMDTAAGTSDLGSQVACIDVEEGSKKYPTSNNFDFKVVRLPFDPKYLDELRRMESTVWSGGEATLVPSPEFLMESLDEIPAVAEVPSADTLMTVEAAPEDLVPVIEMPPLPEEELQDLVPTVEPPADDMVCEADICPVTDVPVAEEAPVTELKNTAEPPVHLMDKADGNQRRCESTPDHQDTSFESLPTYLPSSSWLSDFDSIHYCSKMPPTPKKIKPLNNHVSHGPSRRKLDLEYKEPAVRKPKERYKPKGKADRRSLSDHECCISRNLNENTFLPYGSKGRRLCTRCLGKQRADTPASTGLDDQALKRKASPFKQWNDLPTCDVCRGHPKRQLREDSSPDVRRSHRGHDTEGDSSENSSCRTALKWRTADERRFAVIKKPLAPKQNLEQCPTATYRKLSEKNCVCNELQHHPATWQRLHHCPHGNTIREMDENCAMVGSIRDKWRNTDHTYLAQRCQTEKSWNAVMPNHEMENFKNEARAQYLNKHKTSQPQSQGTYRKDTRC